MPEVPPAVKYTSMWPTNEDAPIFFVPRSLECLLGQLRVLHESLTREGLRAMPQVIHETISALESMAEQLTAVVYLFDQHDEEGAGSIDATRHYVEFILKGRS